MVTTNEKSVIGTQTQKRKESKYNTKDRGFSGKVKAPCFHCRGRRFDPWSGN